MVQLNVPNTEDITLKRLSFDYMCIYSPVSPHESVNIYVISEIIAAIYL